MHTHTVTDNSDDDILESEADGYDPMVEYVLLGEDVSDGILGWAAIGIDATASVSLIIEQLKTAERFIH